MTAPTITAEQARGLAIARAMAAAGIPIFVAPPDSSGRNKSGFHLPRDWEHTPANPAVVDTWRPGWALCAVGGHAADFLDIDPRNGGAASVQSLNGSWPATYGRQSTPSGGDHYLVAPLRVGKGELLAGVDLQGGRPDGGGRGFVFIAPTVRRSKVEPYEPAPYRWIEQPDLAKLAQCAPVDTSGLQLAAMLPVHKTKVAEPDEFYATADDVPHTTIAADRNIAAKGMEVTASAQRGWGEQFRATLNRAAFSLGAYVGSGYMSEQQAIDHLSAAIQLAGHLPDDNDLRWIVEGIEDGTNRPIRVVRPTAPLAQSPSDDNDSRDWSPVDLTAVISGNRVVIAPELGKRTDGVPLLYRGKEHAVAGEPESGKTWFVLMLVADVLRSGGRVVYVDFEDDENTVVGRLLGLRLGKELLQPDVFRYVRPEGRPNPEAVPALLSFPGGPVDLLVYDGWTEGASLLGLDVIKKQEDIAEWRRVLVKPALRMGAATITTDHVVKDPDNRGRYSIGAQHKLAGLTGVMFIMEVTSTWGKGNRGVSRVLVTKDRNGGLRPHGTQYRPNITYIGDLVGDASTSALADVVVFPPRPERDSSSVDLLGPPKNIARHVGLIKDLLQKHQAAGKPRLTKTDALNQITGKDATLRAALEWLVEAGDVAVIEGAHGKHLLELVEPFTPAADGDDENIFVPPPSRNLD